MTTLALLNEKIKSILGMRYEAVKTEKNLIFKMNGFSLGHNLILELIEKKADNHAKKEVMKYCIMIQFGR